MARWIEWLIFCISFLLVVLTAAPGLTQRGMNAASCTYNDKPLYGKVQITENLPDIRVDLDLSYPDLKVKVVESFPQKCGEWQFVESFPDLKVQFVEALPDIKIRFVESSPGIP